MRSVLLVAMLVVSGCAGRPAAVPPSTSYVARASQAAPSASPVTADGTIDAKRLAGAKKMGYSLVNEDGAELFCRTDLKTGSHVQRETVCLTMTQLDALSTHTQQDLLNRPSLPPKSSRD
jgi:hypothetical protein